MHTVSRPPARLLRRLVRLAGVCIGLAAVWACGPVYIPVPPPEAMFTAELTTEPDGTQRTLWITAGLPSEDAANARFYIFDRPRAAGVITTARDDGSYEAPPLEGEMGDEVIVYYENPEGRRSPASCLLLSERRPTAEHCP